MNQEVVWEAAETFHRLHCVQLCSPPDHVAGLAVALTALTLSSNCLRPATQAEIYLLLAVRLKLSWPNIPAYFRR